MTTKTTHLPPLDLELPGELDLFPEDGPLARVHVLENEIEAQVLHAVLEDEHIPHAIECYRDSAYAGIFQFRRGWGAVITRQEDVPQALDVIQRALVELTADEEPPAEE